MTQRETGACGEQDTGPNTTDQVDTTESSGCRDGLPLPRLVSSQAVSWYSVHEYVEPCLTAAGDWPMVGTPAWCSLDDDDPRKLAALFDAAQHWALRLETCQEQRAEASKAVAGAANWGFFGTAIRRHRTSVYVPRRVAS